MMQGFFLLAVAVQGTLPTSFDGSLQAYAAKISQTGATVYSVEATLQQEPVLIRSPDLALESPRIRELVAQAVQGEWVETRPGRWRLEIDRRTLDSQLSADRRQRRDALATWLKELRRAHQGTATAQVAHLLEDLYSYERRVKDGTLIRNSVMSYEVPTPARELMFEFLLQLGADTLAGIEPGEYRTWSNAPVGDQVRLPKACLDAIETYQSASDRLASALAKEDLPSVSNSPWLAFFDTLRRERNGVKCLFTALPTYQAPAYRLRIFDRNGELLDVAGVLGPKPAFDPPANPMPPGRVAESLPVNPHTASFLKWFAEGEAQLRGESRQEFPGDGLLAAADFEPLSVGFGELVTNLSELESKSVVACLPDGVWESVPPRAKEGSLAAKSLWSAVWKSGWITAVSDAGDWILRPTNPVMARRERVGRSALRHLAASVLDGGRSTPRTECVFLAEGGPGSVLSPLAMAWRQCLVPLVSRRFRQVRYVAGALLGSLDGALWRELEAGSPLPARRLAPAQRALFRKWLEWGLPGPYNYEPSVTASNVVYDYALFLDLADDPLVQRTTRGQGTWGAWPVLPTRLSEVGLTLAYNKVAPDDLPREFDGRFTLTPSTSYTASARLGRIERINDDLGDLRSTETIGDVVLADWPAPWRDHLVKLLATPPP